MVRCGLNTWHMADTHSVLERVGSDLSRSTRVLCSALNPRNMAGLGYSAVVEPCGVVCRTSMAHASGGKKSVFETVTFFDREIFHRSNTG